MKQKFYFLIVFAALALFAPQVLADHGTHVGGLFSTDQTWTLAGSPYIVQYNNSQNGVGVASGATLTIEAGVTVKFEANAQLSTGSGKLVANGTASQPIIFTSAAATPAAGDWNRIVLSNDQDSITYAEIQYAARCLAVFFASLTIKNNTIKNCGTGIDISGNSATNPVIQNNTIRNNGYGLDTIVNGFSFSSNNIFSNSVYGARNQVGGSITANGNWWGSSNGPCQPANHADCTGFGNKISSGFTVENFLSAEVGSTPPPPPATGPSSGQIQLTTISPKILKLEANPQSFKEGEEGVSLTWEVESAEYARLEPGGNVELKGSTQVQPEHSTTYRLVALGPGGETTKELTVQVLPRDPVIIVPGILGSFKGKLDPILHTYDGLWEGLKSVGYVEGKTLFAFPYNWRKDNRETAKLLGERIDAILKICSCQEVDVVAHSMGGLVARYYIANINDATIDQLIFLGTPHLGAPKAYLAWEAGEMGTLPSDSIIEKIFELEAIKNRYSNVIKYINERVVALKQLLPIYKYLTSYETGEFYDYKRCKDGLFTCNDFLEELQNQKFPEGLRAYNLVNDKLSTYRTFLVKQREKVDEPKWEHGKPFKYPKTEGINFGSGDETVPIHSAIWGTSLHTILDSSHKELPHNSQEKIIEILLNKTVGRFETFPPRKVLLIAMKSPAVIVVTDSNGNSYGAGFGDDGNVYYDEELEFMTIPDPVDGQYSIKVTGTGEGEFELETTLIADDLEETKSFSGVIGHGEEFKFSVNTTAESLGDLQVLQTPIKLGLTPTENPSPGDGEGSRERSEASAVIARSEPTKQSPATSTSTPVIPATEPESSLDSGFGQNGNQAESQVKGITTENKKQPLVLYIVSGLAILIAGYLIFNRSRKGKT